MKKILLILSNYRCAEKIYSVIPELAKYFELDLYLIGLYSLRTPWPGDVDERVTTLKNYKSYISKIYNGPGLGYWGDFVRQDHQLPSPDRYSLAILDDNRELPEFRVPQLYQLLSRFGVKVVGNSHGNEDFKKNFPIGIAFDKMFVLGQKERLIYETYSNVASQDLLLGGIPSNDRMGSLNRKNAYILIITNFLGNRRSIFPVNFDEHLFKNCGAEYLSRKYKVPIVVKQKAKLDNMDYQDNEKYIKSIIECEVVTSTPDLDELVANAAFVISASSTLAFKAIQRGIPTVLLKGTGQVGNFYDYPGLVDLDERACVLELERQAHSAQKLLAFITNTIEGGETFASTKKYVRKISELANN